MRFKLAISFLFFTTVVFAQPGSKAALKGTALKDRILTSDTLVKKLQAIKDSVIHAEDSLAAIQIKEPETTTVSIPSANNQTSFRRALLRISIGLFFLVVLIIGLRRKKK